MKKLLLNGLAWVMCYGMANAQNPYAIASIPEAVKTKASVVINVENIELEIESTEKATMRVHKIYTVLNEDGKRSLFFQQMNTKNDVLEDAEIKVFDANGKQIARYKKKEMMTQGVGEGLIEDGFMTYYPVSAPSYPVTMEIKYERKLKNTLFIPDYRFVRAHEGVVESNFTAIIPPDINLRYKAENTTVTPAIEEKDGNKIYKWSIKNLSPVESEEGAVDDIDRYPHVKLVAEKFSFYGRKGDLSSWQNFGLWIKDLYAGLDELPAARQQFFTQLVKDAPDRNEQIRRIYQYMQRNFRYVSIQMGIGGLKPFPADFTDSKKYGDCKGLSNYMKAALKAVGIPSHIAIINADELPVDPSFPTSKFNHAILCVPGDKDSVWLECTSSTAEYGKLSAATEDRNALLITDQGGVLVSTPKSSSAENRLSSRTTLALAADLSGSTETIFTTRGAYRDLMNYILKEKRDDQKEMIVSYLGFRQPDLFEFTKDSSDEHKTKLKMLMSKVPEFTAGEKCFISPRISKTTSRKLPKAENRKMDFYFNFPFENYDTTIIRLPTATKPESLPEDKSFTCNYASYKSKYWYSESDQSIYSATSLILKQHRIPFSDYASVKKFFDDLIQDDSQKIVIRKPEQEKKAF